MSYEHHPIAAIFPLLEGDELIALADDIEANGQHSPIELFEGKILDGRNRHTACVMRGIEPECMEIDEHLKENNLDPVAYVLSLNLHRRQLTKGQKAEAGVKAKKVEAERAKKRQARTQIKAGKPPVCENLHEPETGRASDKAAKALGISGRTIDTAEKIFGDDATATPELQEAVRKGKASIDAAARVSELPPKEQIRILDKGKKGVAKAAKAIKPKAKKKKFFASDHLTAALGTTGAAITELNVRYGSFEAIVESDEWDHDESQYIVDDLEASALDNKEMAEVIKKSIARRKEGAK